MPVSAETLRLLMAAGVTGDALLSIVASIDADMASQSVTVTQVADRPVTPSALRMRRKRERDKASHVTPVTVTQQSDAPPSLPPQKEKSPPAPPLKKNTPPSDPQTVKRATRLAADWVLPMAWGAWAQTELGAEPDFIRAQAAVFADFWHGKAGKDATKADWLATWRNWMRRAMSEAPRARGSPSGRRMTAAEQTRENLKRQIDELQQGNSGEESGDLLALSRLSPVSGKAN